MSETLRLKVCLVGAPAVGKTSLVRRYVEGAFSEEYLTTIGVRISRKRVEVNGEPVGLVVWDINGDDAFAPLVPFLFPNTFLADSLAEARERGRRGLGRGNLSLRHCAVRLTNVDGRRTAKVWHAAG